jgi:hypothetical protein
MTPANDWSHIELTAGTVAAPTMEDATGVHPTPEDIGKFKFFVDAVDTDGTRLGLYSGEDYEDAIREAEAARVDFEIDHPVRDRVLGDH